MEVLIAKSLIDSYIIYDKFVSANIVLREQNEMEEEIKNSETFVEPLYKCGWYKQRNVWDKWYRNNSR